MSHLPRDIICAIKRLRDLTEKHGLTSLKMEIHRYKERTHTAKFTITALGQYWTAAEDGEETSLEDDWEERVALDLQREIKQSADRFVEQAKRKHELWCAEGLAVQELKANAERTRRLVPDIVTELGIISETAEDVPEPTLDDVQFINAEDNCAKGNHEWIQGTEPARECGCPADPGIHGCHPNVCSVCDISEEDVLDQEFTE